MVLPHTSPKRRVKREERERRPSEAKCYRPSNRAVANSGATLCRSLSNEMNDKEKVDFLPMEKNDH